MSVDVDIACGSGSQVLSAPDQPPPRLTVAHQLEAILDARRSLVDGCFPGSIRVSKPAFSSDRFL
jgi:hypothetical protein